MKALRYLLIAFAVMSVLSVSAQSLAQQPSVEFQSTSSMVGSGSTLPQAAQYGAYTTYETGGPARVGSGIKRGLDPEDDPGQGGDGPVIPDDNEDPDATPIGDGMLPLALLAFAYLIVRFMRKRTRALNGITNE